MQVTVAARRVGIVWPARSQFGCPATAHDTSSPFLNRYATVFLPVRYPKVCKKFPFSPLLCLPPHRESYVLVALRTEHGARGIWQTIPVTKLDSVFSLQNIATAAVAVKGDKMRTRARNNRPYFLKRDRAFQRAFNEAALSFAREGERKRGREREGRGALF